MVPIYLYFICIRDRLCQRRCLWMSSFILRSSLHYWSQINMVASLLKTSGWLVSVSLIMIWFVYWMTVGEDMTCLLTFILCQALTRNATDAMKESRVHDFLSSVSILSVYVDYNFLWLYLVRLINLINISLCVVTAECSSVQKNGFWRILCSCT